MAWRFWRKVDGHPGTRRLLFSIGIQGALEEVSTLLEVGEHLCAFLDDVYVPKTLAHIITRFSELHRNILDSTHSVSFPATHRQLLFDLRPVHTWTQLSPTTVS